MVATLLGGFAMLNGTVEPDPLANAVDAVTVDEEQPGEGINFIPQPNASESASFVRHSMYGFDREYIGSN